MRPILMERRQNFVEWDIDEGSWVSAHLLVGGVADDTVDPGFEGSVTPERVDLPRHAPERILNDLLGILLRAGNPDGQAIGPIAIRGDKSLCRSRLMLSEGPQQFVVRIESIRHVKSPWSSSPWSSSGRGRWLIVILVEGGGADV